MLQILRVSALAMSLLAGSSLRSIETSIDVVNAGPTFTLADDCDYCTDTSAGGTIHVFDAFQPGARFNCVMWNSCHTNVQSGYCAEWHCPCVAISCVEHDQLLGDIVDTRIGPRDLNLAQA